MATVSVFPMEVVMQRWMPRWSVVCFAILLSPCLVGDGSSAHPQSKPELLVQLPDQGK